MTEEEFEKAWNEAFESEKSWTQEDEANYWNGVGTLKILVTLNIPSEEIFEFDILEATGCLCGADEIIGIDYLLKEIWGVQSYKYPFKEGMIYTFHNVSVTWTKGDGFTTDDDVDYYFGPLTYTWRPWTWFKTWISAKWWKHIGWRIR